MTVTSRRSGAIAAVIACATVTALAQPASAAQSIVQTAQVSAQMPGAGETTVDIIHQWPPAIIHQWPPAIIHQWPPALTHR